MAFSKDSPSFTRTPVIRSSELSLVRLWVTGSETQTSRAPSGPGSRRDWRRVRSSKTLPPSRGSVGFARLLRRRAVPALEDAVDLGRGDVGRREQDEQVVEQIGRLVSEV